MVALSSSKAEYVVVISAACQAVWLRRLLVDVHQEEKGATTIFCDNKATIAMTINPAFHSRTKHIDIRYHYIRSPTTKQEIELKFYLINSQVTDVLTKALPIDMLIYFRQRHVVCSFEAKEYVE